jgi:3-hydroxyisobutyrate dehydrogenase-like beta-hydroxyacid dehydrogenase
MDETRTARPRPWSGDGLGAIGDGVAHSVLAAGLPLVVCGVRSELRPPTAIPRRWPHRVGAGALADIVVVAVVDDAQVRHALRRTEPGGGAAGTVFLVVSTIAGDRAQPRAGGGRRQPAS